MKYILTLLLLIAGCSQRIVEYNPETGVIRYKSNHFATDSNADSIKLKTPAGIELELIHPKQDNDSVKATAIVGGVPVVVETK